MSDRSSFLGGTFVGWLGTYLIEENRFQQERNQWSQAVQYWQGRTTDAEQWARGLQDRNTSLYRQHSADVETISYLEDQLQKAHAEILRLRGDDQAESSDGEDTEA